MQSLNITWARVGLVATVLVSVCLLLLGQYHHSLIDTKAAANVPTNWYLTYGETVLGVLSSLGTLFFGWKPTTHPAVGPAPEETVSVLVQKIESRIRSEVAAKVLGGIRE